MKPAFNPTRAATLTLARRCSGRPAFTLVELLVTITIIGVLASLFLAAMASTTETGRIAATRATIVKIHNLVMQRYEMYHTRRVPIPLVNNVGANWPSIAAGWRVDALRALMCVEMPDHWIDITNHMGAGGVATSLTASAYSANWPTIPPPSLLQAYTRRFTAITNANIAAGKQASNNYNSSNLVGQTVVAGTDPHSPSTQYEAAECLYMICTTGTSDELDSQEQFRQSEIGDFDNDGAPEFWDAWGQPISFLRWAPGFVSELQTGVDPDPFDPRHIYKSIYPSPAGTPANANYPPSSQENNAPNGTYALYPLIYSSGPDKLSGITSEAQGTNFNYATYNYDPFASCNPSNAPLAYGTPSDTGSSGGTTYEAGDNIHNHMLGSR